MSKLHDLLTTNPVILADGAMGTQLFARGLESGMSPELWNIEHPDRVMDVHRSYAEAGTQMLLTNSFGGTRFRLALHKFEGRVYEFNRAAAEITRNAVQDVPHIVLIGGSVGPSGELLEPLGTLTFDEAVDGFAEQATALRDGGVDYFQVETMSALEEVEAAIKGIRRVSDLPIVATMSFDTNRRTMMGIKPEIAAHKLPELGADVIGANCGTGVPDNLFVLEQMAKANPNAILFVKSNAGVPQYKGGELIYNGTPEVMADYAVEARNLGARIIGACCGSSPAHLAAMRERLGL
ncbi:MAG: betaine--homocysteine S-methyltransferase [Anaerolineae bacterium]|nr:betaine--homocysteine S-methyltransferase [Anaerolineae bacterium]